MRHNSYCHWPRSKGGIKIRYVILLLLTHTYGCIKMKQKKKKLNNLFTWLTLSSVKSYGCFFFFFFFLKQSLTLNTDIFFITGEVLFFLFFFSRRTSTHVNTTSPDVSLWLHPSPWWRRHCAAQSDFSEGEFVHAAQLLHCDLEGVFIGVVFDDVVVHVDQDTVQRQTRVSVSLYLSFSTMNWTATCWQNNVTF